jgi:hypothetical protein
MFIYKHPFGKVLPIAVLEANGITKPVVQHYWQ